MSQNILLESGTNELEIVVFKVGEVFLGVNVAKVECIINSQPFTRVPNTHENVKGVINYRGRVIPLIDLIYTLKKDCDKKEEERLVILVNINNSDFAIEVSSVEGIKRLSWEDIEVPSPILISDNKTPTTGIVKISEEKIILLLDFEKILADIDSSLALKESKATGGLEGKKIVVAEDSIFLMKVVNESFLKAGSTVEKFSNGSDALKYLKEADPKDIYCIITDIEMPVMDGLTLTKNIKSDKNLKEIPVVLFSSLITEATRHKGESVGANAQITKPEINRLVSIVISLGQQRELNAGG